MTEPARPRWRSLYGVLIVVWVAGVAAHVLLASALLRHLADAGSALASVAVVALWVHANRIALARLDEPDAGVGRTHVHIVRSRPRPKEEPYAHLPFDFR